MDAWLPKGNCPFGILERLKLGAPKSSWSITSANFHFQSSRLQTWKLRSQESAAAIICNHPIHFADCGATKKKLTQLCQDDKMRMATYICCAFRKPCLNLKKRDMDWHFKFLMPKIREVTLLASQFMAFKALSSKDSPAGLHGSFRADLGQLKHESSRLS